MEQVRGSGPEVGSSPKNQLLAALSVRDWQRMHPYFDQVGLALGFILCEAGEPLRRIYFPISGAISHTAVFEDGSMAEMATTGREGMVDIGAVLGSDASHSRQVVQVPGAALAISYADFRRLESEIPSFRKVLLSYAQAFLAQALQSVACNAVHSVEERTARWLLMCHDRSRGQPFRLTQELLAEMLGVSRPAVSKVARALQSAGLIRYRRGLVYVNNRPGLEDTSCECYKTIRRKYNECLSSASGGGPGDGWREKQS